MLTNIIIWKLTLPQTNGPRIQMCDHFVLRRMSIWNKKQWDFVCLIILKKLMIVGVAFFLGHPVYVLWYMHCIKLDHYCYFQVYDDTNTNSRTISLLAAVSARVNDADPAETGITSVYTAKWALVVTWVNQRRFETFMTSWEV